MTTRQTKETHMESVPTPRSSVSPYTSWLVGRQWWAEKDWSALQTHHEFECDGAH